MINNLANGKELQIHLFVEYTLRFGGGKITIWGRAYDVKDNRYAYECHIYFNRLVESLVSACSMENTKVSVTIFNDGDVYEVLSPTRTVAVLKNCTKMDTFRNGNNEGRICAGYAIDSKYGCERLRNYMQELKNNSPDSNHVVIFVSEAFPHVSTNINDSYEEKKKKEFVAVFDEWKKMGMDFITLRLKNSNVQYRDNHLDGGCMNYSAYKELSTIPEWTRTADYGRMCFLLLQIGHILSSFVDSRAIQKLGKNEMIHRLVKAEKAYDEKQRRLEEERQRKDEEEKAIWIEIRQIERKKKAKYAYLAMMVLLMTIWFYIKSYVLAIPCAIAAVVMGHKGKQGTKEKLSNVAFVLGIIEFIVIMVSWL